MFEKIQAYLAAQLDIAKEDIERDTTFESLGIDSLDTVEMVRPVSRAISFSLTMTIRSLRKKFRKIVSG